MNKTHFYAASRAAAAAIVVVAMSAAECRAEGTEGADATFEHNGKSYTLAKARSYQLDELDVILHKVQSFTVKDGIIYVMDNYRAAAGDSTFYIKRYDEATGERLTDISFSSTNKRVEGADFHITKDTKGNLAAVPDLTADNKAETDPRLFTYSINPEGGTYAGRVSKKSASPNKDKWDTMGRPAVYGDVARGTFTLVAPIYCTDGKVAVETMEFENGSYSGTRVLFTKWDDDRRSYRAALTRIDDDNLVYSDPTRPTYLYTKTDGAWGVTGTLDRGIDSDIKPNANGFVTFEYDGERFAIYGKEASFDRNVFGIAAWGAVTAPAAAPASRADTDADTHAFSGLTPLATVSYPNNVTDYALNMNLADTADGADGEKSIYIYVPGHALEKYVLRRSGGQSTAAPLVSAAADHLAVTISGSAVTLKAGDADVRVFDASGSVVMTVPRQQTASSRSLAPGLYIAVSAADSRKFIVR